MENQHSTTRSPRRLGREAIVVGGGIGGILSARALADFFDHVTIIERDTLPDGLGFRKGVPQARHVHAVLRAGVDAIETLFPGFEQELLAAGSVSYKPSLDVRVVDDLGEWPPFDVGPSTTSQSRPLFEATLRQRLASVANVETRQGWTASEPSMEGDRVTGVVCQQQGGASEELLADFVVDASGRSSMATRWLGKVGFDPPEETVIGVDIGYASCLLDLPAGALGAWKGIRVSGAPPDQGRIALMLLQEGGQWLLSVGGRGGDHPPGDWEGFLEFTRQLPNTSIYDVIRHGTPASEVSKFRFPASRHRHFERIESLPDGLVPIGDAVCVFNPIYGQGMGVTALEVQALHRLLSERADGGRGLAGLPGELLGRVASIVKTAWDQSAAPDLAYPQTVGERPPNFEQGRPMAHAFGLLAKEDPEVRGLISDVYNLVRPASELDAPWVLERLRPYVERANA